MKSGRLFSRHYLDPNEDFCADTWKEVGFSALGGAVSGGLSAVGLGALGGAVGSLIDSGYSNYKEVKAGTKSAGDAFAETAINVGLGALFGATGSGRKTELAKSCRITNAGFKGIGTCVKKFFGQTTRPTVFKSAKKAIRTLGRYAWGTLKEGFSRADIVSSAMQYGTSKLCEKGYYYYFS